METDTLLIITIALPVLGAFLSSIFAIRNVKTSAIKILGIFNTLILLLETAISIIIALQTKGGKTSYSKFAFGFQIDPLSSSLLVLFQAIIFIVGLFSLYYIETEKQPYYFTLYFSLQLGMSLVLIGDNYFFIFVFWELMVLTGYALVVFEKRKESIIAGFRYLVISSLGSLLLLFGIALLTLVSPNLNFTTLATISVTTSVIGKLSLGFIVLGFGVTGGFVIMNQWLPDAHPAAPAPISSLLSGLLVKTGIYGIYRTIIILTPVQGFAGKTNQALLIIGLITITEGNIMVLAQFMRKDVQDFKRILAYSTTVHLGFLLIAASIPTTLAEIALIMHTINHAIAKSLLFMISGYFIHKFHTRELRELRGIGRKDKVIGAILMISLFSLGGLPLTGGFVSKFLILLALYKEALISSGIGSNWLFWALFIAIANSALAFGGYLWLIKTLVFDPPEIELDTTTNTKEKAVKTLFALLTVIIILIGVYPQIILEPLKQLLL